MEQPWLIYPRNWKKAYDSQEKQDAAETALKNCEEQLDFKVNSPKPRKPHQVIKNVQKVYVETKFLQNLNLENHLTETC